MNGREALKGGAMAKKKKKVVKKTTKKKVAKKKAAKKKTTKKTAKKKATKKAVKKKVTKKKMTKKSKAKKSPVKKVASKKKGTKKVSSAPLKVYNSKVAEGKRVPLFSAPMTGEQQFNLSEFKGKNVVIFFYPKDHTPGCTIEGHDFTKLKPQFSAANTEVFGVSRDSIKSHEKFIEKQSYTIELISDEDEALCAIFGTIKLKNMYGKQVRGIDRSTFVIDENGKLIKEWRKVKVPDHAQEVLQFIKSRS